MPVTALNIEHVSPRTLVPADYNPREITPEARERLMAGLRHFGFVEPIVARRSDNLIIGGHQRLDISLELGYDTVPVVFVDDLSDDDAMALNVLLNNPEAQGRFNLEQLAHVFDELNVGGFDVSLTGYDPAYIDQLLTETAASAPVIAPEAPPLREEAADVDVTPPEAPRSVAGQLYVLGRHRLFCGDATNPAHVAALLDGAAPRLTITDPPYGVEYDPEWRNEFEAATGGRTENFGRSIGTVDNDDRIDWTPALRLAPGKVLYYWHAGIYTKQVQESIEAVDFTVRAQIIWKKPMFIFGRGHYHWQHEPCFYAVRDGATAEWIGDRSSTTVWEIDSMRNGTSDEADQRTGHSTQKPIECMRRPMRNHAGDVYDPFGGTGTTLIAAEQLGRTCWMMELNPAYCDVIRRRYAQYMNDESYLP